MSKKRGVVVSKHTAGYVRPNNSLFKEQPCSCLYWVHWRWRTSPLARSSAPSSVIRRSPRRCALLLLLRAAGAALFTPANNAVVASLACRFNSTCAAARHTAVAVRRDCRDRCVFFAFRFERGGPSACVRAPVPAACCGLWTVYLKHSRARALLSRRFSASGADRSSLIVLPLGPHIHTACPTIKAWRRSCF